MSNSRSAAADGAATAALVLVILAVSIALALGTDWNIVVRGAIAVVLGIIAAAVTFAVVKRGRSDRSPGD